MTLQQKLKLCIKKDFRKDIELEKYLNYVERVPAEFGYTNIWFKEP